jgi:hypothetical protein
MFVAGDRRRSDDRPRKDLAVAARLVVAGGKRKPESRRGKEGASAARRTRALGRRGRAARPVGVGENRLLRRRRRRRRFSAARRYSERSEGCAWLDAGLWLGRRDEPRA